MENTPETDTGVREGSLRQVPAASSYRSSGGRKKYIPEPLAAHYRRNGINVQQERNHHTETGFLDRTPENSSDMGAGTAPDMALSSGEAGTVQNGQESPTYMADIRERTVGRNGAFGADTETGQDGSHSRKKKQVYAYCRLPELLTKREVQYETNREQVGNDGNPREIKGYSEFEREKMKHL